MATLSATTLAREAAAQLERPPPPSVVDSIKTFSPLAVMDRRPCGCLLLWMLLPLLAGVLVVPDLHLTDPTAGWRVKHHPTASALDALILATRETGVVGDALPGASDDFGAATSALLNAGDDCWDGCFGQPGVCGWCGGAAGACCMRGATGSLASEACGGPAIGPSTVGCDSHHCCVNAIYPPTPPEPMPAPPPEPVAPWLSPPLLSSPPNAPPAVDRRRRLLAVSDTGDDGDGGEWHGVQMTLFFSAPDGENLLTAARVRQVRAMEQRIAADMREAGYWAPTGVHRSMTKFLFHDDGSLACGDDGGDDDDGDDEYGAWPPPRTTAEEDACVQRVMRGKYAERPFTRMELAVLVEMLRRPDVAEKLEQLAGGDLEGALPAHARAIARNLSQANLSGLSELNLSAVAAHLGRGNFSAAIDSLSGVSVEIPAEGTPASAGVASGAEAAADGAEAIRARLATMPPAQRAALEELLAAEQAAAVQQAAEQAGDAPRAAADALTQPAQLQLAAMMVAQLDPHLYPAVLAAVGLGVGDDTSGGGGGELGGLGTRLVGLGDAMQAVVADQTASVMASDPLAASLVMAAADVAAPMAAMAGALIAEAGGINATCETMASLLRRAVGAAVPPAPPSPPDRCADVGCGWTRTYRCPGTPETREPHAQVAHADDSLGFHCCCERPAMGDASGDDGEEPLDLNCTALEAAAAAGAAAANAPARQSPRLIREHYGCYSDDRYLGDFDALDECDAACVAVEQCQFFTFGNSDQQGRCYAEFMADEGCPEGWKVDSFDIYEVSTAQPAVELPSLASMLQQLPGGGSVSAWASNLSDARSVGALLGGSLDAEALAAQLEDLAYDPRIVAVEEAGRAADMHRYMSNDWDGGYASASLTRLDLRYRQLPPQDDGSYRDALRIALLDREESWQAAYTRNGDVDMCWDLTGGFIAWRGMRQLGLDLLLAVGSLVLVYVFICAHSRSLLLGSLGALQIGLSFPLSLYVYRKLLGIPLFGVLHVIGIYVILGIGCDDLFILLDAFTQSAWEAPPSHRSSILLRMRWAYRRAISAIFVTTLTDCMAFLASAVCDVPNLISFGIFTALLAVSNLLLVATMWPCALMLHERRRQKEVICCRCVPASTRRGLASWFGRFLAALKPMGPPAAAKEGEGDEAPSVFRLARAQLAKWYHLLQGWRVWADGGPTLASSDAAAAQHEPDTPQPAQPAQQPQGEQREQSEQSGAEDVDEVGVSVDVAAPPEPAEVEAVGEVEAAGEAGEAGEASTQNDADAEGAVPPTPPPSPPASQGDDEPAQAAGEESDSSATAATGVVEAIRSWFAPYPSSDADVPPSPRSSGASEGDDARPPVPRVVEAWFANRFAPWMLRGRNAAYCAAALLLVATLFGVQASYLQAADSDVQIWPKGHNVQRYLTLRDSRFGQPTGHLYLLYGAAGVDRTGTSRFDEEDIGVVVWDDGFDASDPAAQVALRRVCVEPPPAELDVVDGMPDACPIGSFADWAEQQRNATWPLPRARFGVLLREWLDLEPWWLSAMSLLRLPGGALQLRHVMVTYRVPLERHAPAKRRDPKYHRWQAYRDALNAAAPRTAGEVLQVAVLEADPYWLTMAIQQLLFNDVFIVIACSIVVAFVVVLAATRSMRGALLSLLTILCVLACLIGIMVGVYDLTLGMLESIICMVAVGLMLDPFTHYVHAFAHAKGPRAVRLRFTLASMGISVLAATLSTAGACSALFFTVIVFFSRFGVLLCTLMLIALLYANLFLAPILLLLGPRERRARTAADVLCGPGSPGPGSPDIRSPEHVPSRACRGVVPAAEGSIELT